ncbi:MULTISPECIES: ParA family protein [Methylobacterium]|uniref:Chromosome partitioning protein ParA n=1 Tax=Methylobacterium nonmethylotrophicum TaxID=1141884 RepID=A0A4Z0NC35_9HYPH|nr:MULTISPECIES: ParA family protein [Methylobacterium]TGD91810.1 chromosome partitioning protein ParA [Methylobacterium nonmethylotrophicum]SFF72173.1 chromosome partitioning protein [Methylobacterium sp. yr596]
MPVVSLCSTKGGVGKTTLAICLASAAAKRGAPAVILDADPNGHVRAWREAADREGRGGGVDVISGVTELSMQDRIAEAVERYALVVIDLEGAASKAVTYAIAESDIVVIPSGISGMDLQEVFRTHAEVRRAEKFVKRPIPARVIFTGMATIASRVAKHARQEVVDAGIPVLATETIRRPNAYQAMHFNGLTPLEPDGDPKAAAEITRALDEILAVITPADAAAA